MFMMLQFAAYQGACNLPNLLLILMNNENILCLHW